MKEYTLTDIPESDVEMVKESFLSEGCTISDVVEQDNGMWSITASCPDD